MRVHVRVRVRVPVRVCSCVSVCVRVCPRVPECVRVCQARQVYRHGEFTNTLCLQNKNKTVSLQTRYVYKTKPKQIKTYKHDSKFTDVMFTKEKKRKQNSNFTDTLCLQKQNGHKTTENKNKTVSLQTMFTKQKKTKQNKSKK